MAILQKFNEIQSIINEIRNEAVYRVPDTKLAKFNEQLEQIQNLINDTAGPIEKSVQDKETKEKLKSDLKAKMDESALYYGILDSIKEEMIDKIIDDPDINFIDQEAFEEKLSKDLSKLEDEMLISVAYSKADIISLGDTISDPEASDSVKYEAGMEILKGTLKKEQGLNDIIVWGVDRIIRDSNARKDYLIKMYGTGE